MTLASLLPALRASDQQPGLKNKHLLKKKAFAGFLLRWGRQAAPRSSAMTHSTLETWPAGRTGLRVMVTGAELDAQIGEGVIR
jgi:hypothetical protein